MAPRIHARPRSSWDRVWAAASDARTVGAALVVAAVFAALNDARLDRTLEPAVRFFSGIAAGSAMLLASRLILAVTGGERVGSGAGLMGVLRREESGGSARGAFAAAALVWLVAVVPSLLLFAGATPLAAVGGLEVLERDTTDRFRMNGPLPGTWHMLGARLTVEEVRETPDGAAVRVRLTDAAGDLDEERTLLPGDALRLGAHRVVVRGTSVSADPGAVRLSLARRDGPEQREEVVRIGGRLDLEGGAFDVVSAEASYLGQLGPAVQLREWQDGAPLRTFWLYARAPEFDLRHGAGAWSVRFDGFEPARRVHFAVSTSPFAGAVSSPWVLVWLVLVALVVAAGRGHERVAVPTARGAAVLQLDAVFGGAPAPWKIGLPASLVPLMATGGALAAGQPLAAAVWAASAGAAMSGTRVGLTTGAAFLAIGAAAWGPVVTLRLDVVAVGAAAVAAAWGTLRVASRGSAAQVTIGLCVGGLVGWMAAWGAFPSFDVPAAGAAPRIDAVGAAGGLAAWAGTGWFETLVPWVAVAGLGVAAAGAWRGRSGVAMAGAALVALPGLLGAAGVAPGTPMVRRATGEVVATAIGAAPAAAWSLPVAASLVGLALALAAAASERRDGAGPVGLLPATMVIAAGGVAVLRAFEQGLTLHEADAFVMLLPLGASLLGLQLADRRGGAASAVAAAALGFTLAASGAWG